MPKLTTSPTNVTQMMVAPGTGVGFYSRPIASQATTPMAPNSSSALNSNERIGERLRP